MNWRGSARAAAVVSETVRLQVEAAVSGESSMERGARRNAKLTSGTGESVA